MLKIEVSNGKPVLIEAVGDALEIMNELENVYRRIVNNVITNTKASKIAKVAMLNAMSKCIENTHDELIKVIENGTE